MDINLNDFYFSMAALLFVIALIGAAGAIARRFGFGLAPAAQKSARRRLSVIETKSLDAKRRLVLIKRDRTEHLILLGSESELLIETGISPPPAANEAPEAAFIQAAGVQAAAPRGNLALAAIGGGNLAAK